MKRSIWCKLACGAAVAVVGLAACSEAWAQPRVVRVYPPMYPPIVRPYHVHPPVIVQPPIVYRQPVVVYAGVAANPAPAPIDATVVNPAGSGATLSFTIHGVRYLLAPGTQQTLHFAGPRTVEFDRGGEFGIARYSLRTGVYTFAATDRGWTLQFRPY